MQADRDDYDEHPGSNRDFEDVFHAPGERFSAHTERQIVYAGNDYGAAGDVIAIRLRFITQGAWSDEDGLWPTVAGAIQIDDVTVTHAGGTFVEDFEGPGPWLLTPMRGPSVTEAPMAQRPELSVSPNPLNPSTLVSFKAAPGTTGRVEVLNLRGELVRTLHSGEFATQEFRWDGTDRRGARVSSGVYLIRATDTVTTQTTKVALVK